eukprot:TRINITY_DN6125_c0_g1_i1.p1 TRINITY_DN6125_c0_g1~~TRINITY_DN6125_c0_g1_i1.p1  ORF type:complete len:2110 (-),score=401.82 TRINITY_DN6125_c0_g1_i1:18-5717(-)
MALYDLASQKKVSADFYTHTNSKEILKLMGAQSPGAGPQTAIFRFPPGVVSENLFLVSSIEKVLIEDSDAFVDWYSKEKMKDKEKAKWAGEIQDSVKRLSAFRQTVSWTATQLFSGGKLASPGSNALPLCRLNKTRDLWAYLDEVKKKAKSKYNYGTLSCKIQWHPSGGYKGDRLDHMLCKVLPFSGNSNVAREVPVFPCYHPLRVNTEYEHCLYLHPGMCTISRSPGIKVKNLMVEFKLMASDVDPNDAGLAVIFDNSFQNDFVTEKGTRVWFNEKKPTFMDEIKMLLPPQLGPKHHVLITYYNVQVKATKKSDASTLKTVLGYSFLPLFTDRILDSSQTIELGIVKELTSGYLSQDPETIPWLEKKKATLNINVTLDSSLYPKDRNLSAFLCVEATQAQVLLQESDTKEVIRFLPQVIYLLSKMMDTEAKGGTVKAYSTRVKSARATMAPSKANLASQIASAAEVDPPSIFSDFVWVISVVEENNSEHFLDSFIQNIYESDETPDFWITLVKCWVSALVNNDTCAYDSLRYARFLFSFILKGLTLSISAAGLLDKETTRPKRISPDQKRQIFALTSEITSQVLTYYCTPGYDKELGRMLNTTFAHFVSDLFTILDRGVVSEIVFKILEDMDKKKGEDTISMKLHFLRILAQSPIFTLLTCPMIQSQFDFVHNVPKNWTETHFLCGMLSGVFTECLKSSNSDLILMGFNTLAALFYWIDHDSRFSADVRPLIGDTYFPVLISIIDQWEKLRIVSFDKEAARVMYGCIAWLLQGTSHHYLQVWWEKETERRIRNFFHMLQTIVSKFLYKDERTATSTRSGDLYNLLSEKFREIPVLLPRETAGRMVKVTEEEDEKEKKKKKKALDVPTTKYVVDPVITQYLNDVRAQTPKIKLDTDKQHHLEMLLVSEVSLVVLDTCVAFIAKFKNLLWSKLELFEESFKTISTIMHLPQSVDVYSKVFYTLHCVLPEFQSIFFSTKNAALGEIVYELVKCFNSKIRQTREEAIAFYISLIDANIDEAEHIARTKLQTTIATTRLVGEENAGNEDSFRILLDTFGVVTKFFQNSTEKDCFGSPLSKQMKELQTKINKIIEGYVKMQEYRYDPEMMAFLYEDIACQLLDSPDERITWLESLSSFHENKQNLEECAQTKILTAALIQEYLTLIDRWDTKLPAAFNVVSPNTEKMMKLIPQKNTLLSLESEICQSRLFNHEGFVGLLKEAIEMLKQGGYYESAVEAYRMMLPIYQETADYARQHVCYKDLVELTNTLMDTNQMQQRIFSNYYRVAFYGKKLKDLDGKTYIYKEKNTVMLPVFAQNIMAQYGKKFGTENVVSLPNKAFNIEDLDPEKIYLQLGAVHIFFTNEELEERNTEWKRVFNLQNFYMDQPFTKGEKVHAESAADQWIRRHVFTTEYAFPHLQKRILVTKQYEVEVAPIANATQAILDKTQNLKSELNMSAPRLKILQIHLQGILLIQVNAGPMALVEIFLSEKEAVKYSEAERIKLVDAFTDFMRSIQLVVSLNGQLIGPDQKQLQETLEEQLDEMKKKLAEYPIFHQRKTQLEQDRQDLIREQRKRAAQTLSEVESASSSGVNKRFSIKENRRLSTGAISNSSIRSDRRKSGALSTNSVTSENISSPPASPTSSSRKKSSVGSSGSRSKIKEKEDSVKRGSSSVSEKSDAIKRGPSSENINKRDSLKRGTSQERSSSIEKKKKPLSRSTSDAEDGVRIIHKPPTELLDCIRETTRNSSSSSTSVHSTSSAPSTPSSVKTVMFVETKTLPPQDDKVGRARGAILQLSGEIRGILRGMEMLLPTISALEEGLNQVKPVRKTNEILKTMSSVISIGDYSYANPPPSQDKMATIKYILQKEIGIATNLLKDLENNLSNIVEVSQLVTLLKVVREIHGVMKN